MVIDAIDGQSVKFEKWCIPLSISSGQVVIHRYDMHASFCQCVEIGWECGNQRFTLSRLHLSDFTLMQYYSTNELHIVVNHVPNNFCSGSFPLVFPGSCFTADFYIVFFGSYFFVVLRSCNDNFLILSKSPSGFFHHSKAQRKDFDKHFFQFLVTVTFELVYLSENFFFLMNIQGLVLIYLLVQVFNLIIYIP